MSITGNGAFPSFDRFHAHCAMTVTFNNLSCVQAYDRMKDLTEEWAPEPKAGGIYAMWTATEEEQLWVTRTTPTKHYIDDIIFEYFGNPADFEVKGCTVKGRSRSQTLSYYDYDTNFCNMWNVFDALKQPITNMTVSDCKF